VKKPNGAGPPAPRQRYMKRFPLPERCDAKEFVIRELDSNDDIQAAIMADKMAPAAIKDSAIGLMSSEQREAVRLSLVEVDGVPVNQDGIPFLAMDEWSARTMRFALQAYMQVNGVTPDEIRSFLAGAEVVTGPETPTTTFPASQLTGGASAG